MLSMPNPSIAALSGIYNSNSKSIAASLARIASGKRVNAPSDDFAGYIRASQLSSDVDAYTIVKQNLQDAKGIADYATEVGNSIVEDLTKMKMLFDQYTAAAADPVAQAGYKASYDAAIQRITDTKANSYYDNTKVYAKAVVLKAVSVNPTNVALTVSIQATAIANEAAVNNIANAASSDIQNEIANAQTYTMQMKSYASELDRYSSLADTVINSKNATISVITDINDASEMSILTALQVRQQATVAMMAQSNLIQGYAAKFYGGLT